MWLFRITRNEYLALARSPRFADHEPLPESESAAMTRGPSRPPSGRRRPRTRTAVERLNALKPTGVVRGARHGPFAVESLARGGVGDTGARRYGASHARVSRGVGPGTRSRTRPIGSRPVGSFSSFTST